MLWKEQKKKQKKIEEQTYNKNVWIVVKMQKIDISQKKMVAGKYQKKGDGKNTYDNAEEMEKSISKLYDWWWMSSFMGWVKVQWLMHFGGNKQKKKLNDILM